MIRVAREGEVLIWCRKCSGHARQRMGPKLMNCCKTKQAGTKEYGKMINRIQILEDGSVFVKGASLCQGAVSLSMSLDSDWEVAGPQTFSFSRKPRAVAVENQENISCEGRLCRPRHSRARSRRSRPCSGKMRWRTRRAATLRRHSKVNIGELLVKERFLREWSSI